LDPNAYLPVNHIGLKISTEFQSVEIILRKQWQMLKRVTDGCSHVTKIIAANFKAGMNVHYLKALNARAISLYQEIESQNMLT
jgi:hypothetical protein